MSLIKGRIASYTKANCLLYKGELPLIEGQNVSYRRANCNSPLLW
uniref:Uncharacterized protein n=1 Tax=Myoviridae sp. ctlHW5 TaxID=2826691 RepID=A0A8S5N706_9CAUD|nr:MAG TPA: hypothetical protein [Myoviridae sp. ctlHW5]